MLVGCVFQAAGFAIYGLLKFIPEEDQTTFLIGSIIGRLGSGVGAGILFTPAYAFLPQFFRENLEKKIMLIEVAAGIGMSLGAPAASALYSLGGYLLPFFCGSGLMVALIFIQLLIIPSAKTIEKYNTYMQLVEEPDEKSTTTLNNSNDLDSSKNEQTK